MRIAAGAGTGLLLALCHLPAWPGAPDKGVEEVRACMARNLVEKGALRELRIESSGPAGGKRGLSINLYWRPDADRRGRINLRVTAPKDLAGAAYLLRETAQGDDMHVYIPATQSVTRIVGDGRSQPLWGTDFSYEEIKLIQGLLSDGSTQRRPDAVLGKRGVYVLETRTEGAGIGVRRVVSYVDRTSCTLLKAEFFGAGDAPVKVLEGDVSLLFETDDYEKKIWLLLGYTMRDLQRGSKSVISLGEIHLLEDVPRAAFDPKTFHQPFDSGR